MGRKLGPMIESFRSFFPNLWALLPCGCKSTTILVSLYHTIPLFVRYVQVQRFDHMIGLYFTLIIQFEGLRNSIYCSIILSLLDLITSKLSSTIVGEWENLDPLSFWSIVRVSVVAELKKKNNSWIMLTFVIWNF